MGKCEVTGLGCYYCLEFSEFYPSGRAVGLPKKDGLVALKQLSVFQHTVSDQSTRLLWRLNKEKDTGE